MLESNLELKGSSFTLSVLHIKSAELQKIRIELEEKLAIAPQFFLGAPLVLNLAAVAEQDINLSELKQILIEQGLVIVGVTSGSESQLSAAKDLGLAVIKPGKTVESKFINAPKSTQIVKKNIRSGQQIYAKNADLIVVGTVSNGAEVIADGSIHIYGTLRGKAMAGATGDNNAVIIAHRMESELISIAGQYWLAENLAEHDTDKACCIRLADESLLFEPLTF
ncbi:septum site-determining protein MinC [Parashewanella curva]|uniref:Probable septum site-determining protein MinC n=1 Tax=Parashewanella curva TaxID=2338552 RepID=A0A3L8Q2P2_9GAMM|nr:septum site-determining protein MinC [Parashewanella curva]RLV61258.1 septum site-determining protein MinC [Parashewanella curva]